MLKQNNINSQSLKSNKGPGNKQDKFLNVGVKKHNLHKPSSGFTDENKTWLKPAKGKKMPIENSDDNASSFEDEEEEIDDDIEVSTENDEEQSEEEDEDEEEEDEDEEDDDEDEEDESCEDDNLDDSSTIPPKNILQNNKRKNIEAKVGYITKPINTQ